MIESLIPVGFGLICTISAFVVRIGTGGGAPRGGIGGLICWICCSKAVWGVRWSSLLGNSGVEAWLDVELASPSASSPPPPSAGSLSWPEGLCSEVTLTKLFQMWSYIVTCINNWNNLLGVIAQELILGW